MRRRVDSGGPACFPFIPLRLASNDLLFVPIRFSGASVDCGIVGECLVILTALLHVQIGVDSDGAAHPRWNSPLYHKQFRSIAVLAKPCAAPAGARGQPVNAADAVFAVVADADLHSSVGCRAYRYAGAHSEDVRRIVPVLARNGCGLC